MNSASKSKDYSSFSNTLRAIKKNKNDLTLAHKEKFTQVFKDV